MISSVSCALFVVKSVRPIVFNKNSSHLINSLDYVIDNINFEFVNNGNGILASRLSGRAGYQAG
jgi:hypothetical protein